MIRDDSAESPINPAQKSGDGNGMRARLGWLLAFFSLVATAPTSFTQSPAAAPVASKSAPQGSPDVTEQTLYSFCSPTNCAYGNEPSGDLIMDTAGNLYGTAYMGGGTWPGGLFTG
jgi:hypothetical protein